MSGASDQPYSSIFNYHNIDVSDHLSSHDSMAASGTIALWGSMALYLGAHGRTQDLIASSV